MANSSIDRARRTTLEIMIESLTGTRVHSRGGGMEYWIIAEKVGKIYSSGLVYGLLRPPHQIKGNSRSA